MTEPTGETALRGPEIWVVGIEPSGTEGVRRRLGHGEDPMAVLRALGYDGTPRTVVGQTDPYVLEIVFDVVANRTRAVPGLEKTRGRDIDLVVRPGEVATVRQRPAAYAIVRSVRGLLFTQYSALTSSHGFWGPAGGGLDPGEMPEPALHREVWEETGQRVELLGLVLVTSRHWVGRAPGGQLEDFHAVRLVYTATCPEPTDAVVHDVDGTTSSAVWVAQGELGRLRLTPGWRETVMQVLDETLDETRDATLDETH